MKVTLRNIVKKFGATTAVQGINLEIADGALHFILGPSGCGKTTTLRMLAGLDKPTSGQILFGERDVTHDPAAERGIGMVFQNYALWPHMTVRKNIEYGLKLRKLTKDAIKKRISEVLSFTQLDQYEDRYPGQLSGGQQQRVALARALAIRPNVLLLDEPLSNLDAQLRLEMRDNITRIHRETGITTVYVTHDQKEALSMGTSVSVMRKGILMQTAAPRAIYLHPNSAFIASFIGETNILRGKVLSLENGKAKAQCALGELTGEALNVKVADDVAISIRPEAINLEFPNSSHSFASVPGDLQNRLQFTIDHLVYLGECEQFSLVSEQNVRVKSTLFHTSEHGLERGNKVRAQVGHQDVQILPWDETLNG